jgi:predicted small secreted protein
MKRSLAVILTLTLAAVVGCNSKRRAGNDIVAKIERFKKSTGHLPSALSDIGVTADENCPCYCKTGDGNYIVWYGTTLGESDTYDSQTKKWSEASGAVCSR